MSTPDGAWQRFFTALTERILVWRWPLALLLVLGTIGFGFAMRGLKIETRNEIWFVEGDPTLELMHEFEELFGNDDFVFVVFESPDFFRADTLHKIRALAEDLEANVPHLMDMTWLGNAEYIQGFEERVDIHELIETVPETPEALAELRRKALAEPLYLNSLISADGRVAGLLLEMYAYPEGDQLDPRKDVAPAVRKVLARPEYAALGLHAVGGPIMDYDLDVITAREGALFFGLALLMQAAILSWLGRGVRGVLAPLVVVSMSVIWCLGLTSLLGFGLNLFAIMVPVLLICVGIGDSMHVIAEFHDQRDQGLERREALKRAMGSVGLPCLLTSLTTAAGFLSFLSVRIQPFREMGIYCAMGVVLAVLITYVLLPVLYSFGAEAQGTTKPAQGPERNDLFDRLLGGVHRIVVGHRAAVLAVFAALLVLSAIGYSRLEVESNFIKQFSEDVPVRMAYDFVDERMGGSMSIEMLLNTGQTDGITDPLFLREMAELDRFVGEREPVTKTLSVLDILKQMRRAFNENRPEYYTIPEERAEAAQFLLLYEMSGGDDREKFVTFSNDVARLTARTRSLSTRDVRQLMSEVEDYKQEHFNADATLEFTGMMSWVNVMSDLISQGQRQSFLVAFMVIGLIMMLVLRSVVLGLISMIPNVFPVFISLGYLGLSGTYMDLMMMCFAAVIIGVAVDDTIHFFMRYRREFGRLGNYSEALRVTLTTVGRPITFTTITLTLGFAVMGFSDVGGIVHFGLLAGFAFSWALLADLFFAPALILWLKPLGAERA